MGILQTAERSSHLDPSENVIYQRHVIAYKEAAKIISGTVLEIGSGEGFGIAELAPQTEHYIAVDKYNTAISKELQANNKITFIRLFLRIPKCSKKVILFSTLILRFYT